MAATLAEQDQERLRSYRFDELTKLVGAAGSRPRAQRRRRQVQRSSPRQAGQSTTARPTPGCGTAGAKQTEYLRITSTVTSTMVGVRASRRSRSSRSSRRRVSGSLVVKVAHGSATVPASRQRRGDPTTADSGAHLTAARPTRRAARSSCGVEIGNYTVTHQQAGLRRHARATRSPTVEHDGQPEPRQRRDDELRPAGQHQRRRQDAAAGHDVHAPAPRLPVEGASRSPTTPPSEHAAHLHARPAPASRSRPSKLFPFTTAYSFFTGTCVDPEPGQGRPRRTTSRTTNPARGRHRRPDVFQPQAATVYQPAVQPPHHARRQHVGTTSRRPATSARYV